MSLIGAYLFKKLADVLVDLSKKKLSNQEQLVEFLKEHGCAKLENKFETLYVHSLAVRRFDGAPTAVLGLFKVEVVVQAFSEAWSEGKVLPFNQATQWAVDAFREGEEIRGLGIDVEAEVQRFYETFRRLVQEARSPGEREDSRLLREIHEAVKSPPDVKVAPTEAERFARNLLDWFAACGYVALGEPEWHGGKQFDVQLEKPHPRRPERYFIRGLDGEARAPDYDDLPAPRERDAVESWLVASVAVSASAREKALTESGRLVRTFDELIDEEVDFRKYEAFLGNEIELRTLSERYVPLRCRRPEVDQEGEVRGVSDIDNLGDFVGRWLEQPLAEHVSILGEFGMGKTWFALRLAQRRLEGWHAARAKGLPRGRYPLLVQLRDFVSAPTIESLLSDFFFNRHETRLPSLRAFDVLNRMGRFLLIFDGFDEMARRIHYQKVVDHFWELAKAVVPGSKAVLTCREEHFRYAREARTVLAGDELASQAKIVLVRPRFDVVHLEPFNSGQIREAIVRRQGLERGNRTADVIDRHAELLDLARRPVMIEMLMESMDDLADRTSIVTSQVYLYATDRQIRVNVKQERTFSSIEDKIRFLCELAWEMHSTERLKLNYKLFPDRVRQIFGEKVADEEKDHWAYDLSGQTLLVRDEDGNYSFAHRGLVEYFAAYHLLAQANALGGEYRERYREAGRCPADALAQLDLPDLAKTWGALPFHPTLLRFLAEMSAAKERLLELIETTRGRQPEEVGFLGGNAFSTLARINPQEIGGGLNLENVSLRGARLAGVNLVGVCARGADIRDAEFLGADLRNADLRETRLKDANLTGLDVPGTLSIDGTGTLLFGGPTSGGWVYDLRAQRFLAMYGTPWGNWTADRAVSYDGRWLVHVATDIIRIGEVDYNRSTVQWKEIQVNFRSPPGVAYHPEGWFLVVSGGSFRLTVDTFELQKISGPVVEDAAGVAVYPPWWFLGGSLFTQIWDEREHCTAGYLPIGVTNNETPVVSPGGRYVSFTNRMGLHVFEMFTQRPVAYFGGNASCSKHAWSSDGSRIVSKNEYGLLVIDSRSWATDRVIEGNFKSICLTRDNIIIAVDDSSTIRLFDLRSGENILTIHQVPPCGGADFRGASGLTDRTRDALKKAGARL